MAGNKPYPLRKRKTSNHYFSDGYQYYGQFKIGTRVRHVCYNENDLAVTDNLSPEEPLAKNLSPDSIDWFEVNGLSDEQFMKKIFTEFHVHPMDVRDVLTPNHIVKVDAHADRIVVVMANCRIGSEGKVMSEHICIIARPGLILSFNENDDGIFDPVIESLQTNVMNIRREKSGMLLAFLLNAILTDLIETSISVENKLQKIEKILMDEREHPYRSGSNIQKSRRANLIVSKNTVPLRAEFHRLLQTYDDIIDTNLLQVFNELFDQIEYIIQSTDNSKQMLASLESLFISRNDLKMNSIMKRLTVVSTLFIPITFLVGLWGMNFRFMPELDWKYGYVFALASLAVTALGTWRYMKKRNWF